MLCHTKVRKIARDMAGAAYEELAKDDLFYKVNPKVARFIDENWKVFIPSARESLVTMLGGDYPDAMKKEIFQIYMEDRLLQEVPDGQEQAVPAIH